MSITPRVLSALVPLGGFLLLAACGQAPGASPSSTPGAVGGAGLHSAAITTRYVSPSGSDSSPGTLSQPYATIQKCASVSSVGDSCSIRAGVYRETVIPNSGVSFAPYAGESVTLDGSDPVSGWTAYSGSIYQASVSLPVSGNSDTGFLANQVFAGTAMLHEAQWPNPSGDPMRPNWATMGAGTTTSTVKDTNLPAIDWTGATLHMWAGSNPFGHQTAQVVSSGGGQVVTNFNNSEVCPYICAQSGGRYYLVGKLQALDAPGEWYYDGPNSRLYLWATNNALPANITAKRRNYAFDLRGKSSVSIRNIKLFASTVVMSSASSDNTLDGLDAKYLSHYITLPRPSTSVSGFDVLVAHMYDSGIVLEGTRNVLKNSTLAYSAGNGVLLSGSFNTVQNNLISYVDYMGSYSAGIAMQGGGDNTSSGNTIYATGREGINLGQLTGSNPNFVRHNIGYNRIFDYSFLSLDSGGIYVCCNFDVQASRIHHNWISGAKSGPGGAYTSAGIYIDNSTSGMQVDQNVVWDNLGAGIYLHGNGGSSRNNLVFNNTSLGGQNTSLSLLSINDGSGTRVENNRVTGGVSLSGNATGLVLSNNSATAPGATEGETATVGCSFIGCAGSQPPLQASPGASSLQNPGFEANGGFSQTLSGWTTAASDPSTDYVEAGGHSGSYQGTHYSTQAYWAYTYQNLSGLANGSYTLKAWVKSSGGQSEALMLVKTAGGSVEQRVNIAASSAWTQVLIPGVNVTNGMAEVAFYSSAAANKWINFDDVEFTKL